MSTPGIYITSTAPGAGKNTLCAGLGLWLQQQGLNPGYIKPVGGLPVERDGQFYDEDALFMLQTLGLEDAPEEACPLVITQDFKINALNGEYSANGPDGAILEQIGQCALKLEARHDFMLASGSESFFAGLHLRLDGQRVANTLGYKTLVIDRLEQEVNLDALIAVKDSLGGLFAGVVLNGVSPAYQPEIESLVRPFLERNNLPLLGVIPQDALLGSTRAFALAEWLGGKVISAQDRQEKLVEDFLIGTMQVENFMTHFRRNPKAAVIVGGDRADIQLVALEGDCACLILTGNLYPNEIILSRAEALKIPVIVVREDTYSTARRAEAMLRRNKLRDSAKVNRAANLVDVHINKEQLLEICGFNFA